MSNSKLAKTTENSVCGSTVRKVHQVRTLLAQSRYASRFLALVLAGLLAVSLQTAYQAGWITAKAGVAQILLTAAWEQSKAIQRPVKPWPWMDTHPVARLTIVDRNEALIVLEGTSGEAMAFGPSHIQLPFDQVITSSTEKAPVAVSPGLVAIGGHRDTHLQFLQTMQIGDRVSLETRNGLVRHYSLESTRIVDTDKEDFFIAAGTPGLLLVTCYPFDSLSAGGPLRLVAFARELITDANPFRANKTLPERLARNQTMRWQ